MRGCALIYMPRDEVDAAVPPMCGDTAVSHGGRQLPTFMATSGSFRMAEAGGFLARAPDRCFKHVKDESMPPYDAVWAAGL